MNTSKQTISGIRLITIEEKEANLSHSENFKATVKADIDSGALNIVVSFEHVEYVDSSFLGALVAVLKALLPLNGKLVLIAMNDDILNLFQLTRLDKIFVLKANLEEALEELNG
jgi:anti-sigma B factor antagonist